MKFTGIDAAASATEAAGSAKSDKFFAVKSDISLPPSVGPDASAGDALSWALGGSVIGMLVNTIATSSSTAIKAAALVSFAAPGEMPPPMNVSMYLDVSRRKSLISP